MGDFTSQYRVTYSDGTQRTETRIDAFKAGGNLFLYGIILIALVALLPALIMLPLMVYVTKPYRMLKGSNPEFQSDLLKEYGYSKLGEFQKAVKTHMWLLMSLILGTIIVIDILSFSNGNRIGGIIDYQLKYSMFLVLFYWIIPFIINKDRVLSKQLEGIEKFNFIEKSYKKTRRKIFTFLAIPLIPIFTVVGSAILVDKYEDDANYKLYELQLKAEDIVAGKDTDISLSELNEPIVDNSLIVHAAMKLGSLYNKTYNDYSHLNRLLNDSEEYYRKEAYRDSRVPTNFFHILINTCERESQKCSIPKIINKYKELGGDLNAVNQYGHHLAFTTTNGEATYHLLKLGANPKDAHRNLDLYDDKWEHKIRSEFKTR